MSRAFCIPGVFFLFSAFVLLFIVSISLPYLQAMDIARVHSNNLTVGSVSGVTQLRLGIWGYCVDQSAGRTCFNSGNAYSLTIHNSNNSVTIGSSWTRGLAVHPVATGVSFLALVLSFSQHIMVTLVASLVAFLAALITLVAFAIDIALFAYLKDQMGNLGSNESTITGPGFWITFTSLLLLFLAGCTVCFGRRRNRMAGASELDQTSTKGGLFKRCRRK